MTPEQAASIVCEKKEAQMNTKELVIFIANALKAKDAKALASVGLNEVDGQTYLRVYPQYVP